MQTYPLLLVRKRIWDTLQTSCDTNTFKGHKRTLSLLNNYLSLLNYCLSTNLLAKVYLSNIDG